MDVIRSCVPQNASRGFHREIKEQLEEWGGFPLTFPLASSSQLHVQALNANNSPVLKC